MRQSGAYWGPEEVLRTLLLSQRGGSKEAVANVKQ